MESIFQINPQLDIPIYQQLVDSIRAAIKSGLLQPEQQLPTVQQLSDRLSIARGTIKRAYDELEHGGLVEKVQGRGTFVRYHPQSAGNRKDRAMVVIEGMLNQLEEMGLSPGEIHIFLNLKLRERVEQEFQVKVAVVSAEEELLSQIASQLRQIPHVELYTHQLDSILRYPYQIGEDVDLVVTPAANAQALNRQLPAGKRVVPVALRLCPDCVMQIISQCRKQRAGILSYSRGFGLLLQNSCKIYAEDAEMEAGDLLDASPELADKQVLLLPQGYERYCSAQMTEALQQYTGGRILCRFELDEGSFLHLQEKCKRILESKTL